MPTAYIIEREENLITIQWGFLIPEAGIMTDQEDEIEPGEEFFGWTFDELVAHEGAEILVPKP